MTKEYARLVAEEARKRITEYDETVTVETKRYTFQAVGVVDDCFVVTGPPVQNGAYMKPARQNGGRRFYLVTQNRSKQQLRDVQFPDLPRTP